MVVPVLVSRRQRRGSARSAAGVLLVCGASCAVYDPSLLTGQSEGGAAVGGGPEGGSGGSGDAGSSGTKAAGGAPDAGTAGAGAGAGPGGGSTSGGTKSTGLGGGGAGSPPAGGSTAGGAEPSAGTAPTGRGGASAGAPTLPGGSAGEGGQAGCTDGDCCPDDPYKTEAGACGCGELDTDGDEDGTADCIDGCPEDARKTDAGTCGCGVLEDDASDEAGCASLLAALAHRYSFEGTGDIAVDSIGGDDGTLITATLEDTGALELAGTTSDEYVDLPSGLLATLESVTLEAWVTWAGGAAWQRIFDFGSTSAGTAGIQGTGETYLFLTPLALDSMGFLRATFSTAGIDGEIVVEGPAALPVDTLTHVAVVVDGANALLALYVDGVSVDSTELLEALSGIDAQNSWLGRSLFAVDPELEGSLAEFRIYAAALGALQVERSFSLGPDPAFLAE